MDQEHLSTAGANGGASMVVFEAGHEHAPDAPMGRERLALSADGTYSYERKRARVPDVRATGVIDPARVRNVVAHLERSSFPLVPAHSFPPGAGPVRISMGSASVELDEYFGEELDGYREALEELNAMLRDAGKQASEQSR